MTSPEYKHFINTTEIVFVDGSYCIEMDVDFNDIEVNSENVKDAQTAAKYLSDLARECNMMNDVRSIINPKPEEDIWKPIEKNGTIENIASFDWIFKNGSNK